MIRKSLFIMAIGAGCCSTPTFAQQASDVRCLVLSNAYAANASKEDAKKVAQSVAYFYAGKIEGSWSDEKLRAEIARQRTSLNSATSGPEMQACAQRVQSGLRKLMALSGTK